MGESLSAFLALLLLAIGQAAVAPGGYYGKLIGSLNSQYHGIKGDVYAVDARTLFIKDFSYDGKAQDAVFFAGASPKIGTDGFVIPNEDGSTESLSRLYTDQDLTLTLPEGKTLKEVRWLTVWSRPFSEAFGEIRVPSGFDYPRPQRLTALSGIHKVGSDRVYVVDAQTFLLPNFTYDGGAPDAFFWVGSGSKPSQEGVQVPDENGKVEPLRRYDTKTLVLTLPGDLTIFDVDWLSVWCRAYGIDFGHIRIPKSLNVPPSLKMLGVAPQAKLNCEVLWDDLALEVRWAVAGETIVLQLVGKLDEGQYVAFGPSGDPKRTRMIGADVAVGWLDRASGKGFVHDHFMTSKSPCVGGKGVCQDTLSQRGVNNIRLLNAALVNDYVMLTYQRPLKAQDELDKSIITNGTQAVIWAVGALSADNEPTYHKLRNKGDLLIDFGRSPFWNCPAPEDPTPSAAVPPIINPVRHQQPRPTSVPTTEESPWSPSPSENGFVVPATRQPATAPPPPPPKTPAPLPPSAPVVPNKPPWYVPAIECYEPENHVFYAHVGPSGGSQGYNAITNQVGWGISWFINGLLIPEVTVVRGQAYTFVVEGGQDPDRPSRHHPFYITDDPEGGYEFKTPAERSRHRVYAGVTHDRDGHPAPSAQGRLCEWVEDPAHPPDKFSSFGAYQRTLKLHCEEGEPALLQWTPDDNTPDTVYYQCYTHRYLGWKIRVVDSCEFDNNNRKSINVAKQPASQPTTSRALTDEGELREDFTQDYYDEDTSSRRPQKNNGPAAQNDFGSFAPDHRPPGGFLNDDGFFSGGFGTNFPSEFDEFFKDQSFGKQEERPTNRPTLPPVTRRPQSNRKPAELAPVIIRAQQQEPAPSRPLNQLNKLVNQASPFGQQSSGERFPPRKQVVIERPVQQRPEEEERPDFEPDQQERQEFHHQEPKISPSVPVHRPFSPPAPFQRPQFPHDSFRPGGFNPSGIVLESGFKPIRKSDGPVPPLGFEVESQESHEERHNDRSDAHDNHNFQGSVSSDERHSLVPLDPVFVASDPDHRVRKDPVPITLPKAVVPVVPGPPQAVPKFPPFSRNQQNPNPQRDPPQFPPQFRPPQQQQQQQRHQLPPFGGQDGPNHPAPPPLRRKTSAFSNFFNFGNNRRQQEAPPPHAIGSQVASRQPFQPPQQQQRRPAAGQREQQPPPQQQRQPDEFNRNQNRPQSHQKPQQQQQGLTGMLQRFLGVGDRRKDGGPPESNALPMAAAQQRVPVRLPIHERAEMLRPMMTFQGALPPIIANKIQSATKPVFGNPQRSDRPINGNNVLDPFSASIIGGGGLMGLPNKGSKITDAERKQLERFLFGPGEYFAPRGFDSSGFVQTLEDFFNGGDLSTDAYEYNTENPEVFTETTDVTDGESTVDEFFPVVHNSETESNKHSGEDELSNESEIRDLRQKRESPDEDEKDGHQHLDDHRHPDDIPSDQLPVEHRGLDDDDHDDHDHHEHHHHDHNSSSQPLTRLSLSSALLLCAGLTLVQHLYL